MIVLGCKLEASASRDHSQYCNRGHRRLFLIDIDGCSFQSPGLRLVGGRGEDDLVSINNLVALVLVSDHLFKGSLDSFLLSFDVLLSLLLLFADDDFLKTDLVLFVDAIEMVWLQAFDPISGL